MEGRMSIIFNDSEIDAEPADPKKVDWYGWLADLFILLLAGWFCVFILWSCIS
jgi:hypothetical protein